MFPTGARKEWENGATGLCTAKLTVWKPRHLNFFSSLPPSLPFFLFSFLLFHPPTPANESVRVGINSLALSVCSVHQSVCLPTPSIDPSAVCPPVCHCLCLSFDINGLSLLLSVAFICLSFSVYPAIFVYLLALSLHPSMFLSTSSIFLSISMQVFIYLSASDGSSFSPSLFPSPVCLSLLCFLPANVHQFPGPSIHPSISRIHLASFLSPSIQFSFI